MMPTASICEASKQTNLKKIIATSIEKMNRINIHMDVHKLSIGI